VAAPSTFADQSVLQSMWWIVLTHLLGLCLTPTQVRNASLKRAFVIVPAAFEPAHSGLSPRLMNAKSLGVSGRFKLAVLPLAEKLTKIPGCRPPFSANTSS